MNSLLCSMSLMFSFRIVVLDRLTPFETYYLHYESGRGHALVNYSGDAILCHEAWNSRHYYPEIPFVYLYCNPSYKITKIQPNLNECSGFDCWESHLSAVTRIEIVEIMNLYREKVAQGKCIKWCANNTHRLTFQLRWNYFFEKNASMLLEKCPQKLFINKHPTYMRGVDASGLVLEPVFREDVVTSFKMETGLQSELRFILWRLMYENFLHDWDEKSQFRRGDMHDMSCAFVCRRNVTYVTGLDETVTGGIVGHLACVFVTAVVIRTAQKDVFSPIDTTLTPSQKTCKELNPTAWSYGIELGSADVLTPGVLLFDACAYTPQSRPDLCPGNGYSRITWEEKFYGLILRHVNVYPNKTTLADIGQCNVPPPELPQPKTYGPNILNYNCTLKEVVGVQANFTTCSGWNCADSQLTEATRFQIVNSLNYERNRIAKGECSDECSRPCKRCNINVQYCNMVNVEWHWFLERKVSEQVKNCPTTGSIRTGFTYDDDPFLALHEVVYEEITVVFDLPHNEGQLALPKTFVKLFWMNAFEDWTDYHYFRRANAMFIGCSIITRSHSKERVEIPSELNFYNGMPTHMVCIYASLNGSFHSILEEAHFFCCPQCNRISYVNPCWLNFTKNVAHVESLCFSNQFRISMNCQAGNRCDDDSLSKAWHIQYEGLILVQTLNGSIITIQHSAFDAIGQRYGSKYCSSLIFFFILQIPLWVFILSLIYSHKDLEIEELLKKTLPELMPKQQTLDYEAESELEIPLSED